MYYFTKIKIRRGLLLSPIQLRSNDKFGLNSGTYIYGTVRQQFHNQIWFVYLVNVFYEWISTKIIIFYLTIETFYAFPLTYPYAWCQLSTKKKLFKRFHFIFPQQTFLPLFKILSSFAFFDTNLWFFGDFGNSSNIFLSSSHFPMSISTISSISLLFVCSRWKEKESCVV